MINLRSKHIILGLLATTAIASPAYAQVDPDAEIVAPVRRAIDDNGVNLGTGLMTVSSPAISIGAGSQGLSYTRTLDQQDATFAGWSNPYYYAVSGTVGTSLTVAFGGQGIVFTYDSGTGLYVNRDGTGETLTGSGTSWTFTGRDGTVVQMDATPFLPGGDPTALAVGNTITLPNKQKLTLSYKGIIQIGGTIDKSRVRLQSVQSSNGYMAKVEYASNSATWSNDWGRLTKVTLLNLAVDYCNPTADSCTFSQTWPSLTFTKSGTTQTVTDTLSRTTTYNTASALSAIKRPGSATDNVTIAHDISGKVTSVTRDGRTWTYSWSLAAPLMTATVTNPDSSQTVTITDTTYGRVTSDKNELLKTTLYSYDTKGRLTEVTYPEGNKLQYTYDSRGNVTQQKVISKTAGTPGDIVISASFPSSCSNLLTCNKPTSTTDARGKVTDYTYDSTHGGVLTVTAPDPASTGIRPQTRYSYTTKQAYFKNSGGSIVASGQSTYVLTGVSACQTTSSCSGASDEVKATIDYGPQTSGTANNLLPVSVSKEAGDGSLTATVASTYDAVGNLTYVDGPLSGTADTSRVIYDAGRQVIGQISADPDGGSSLPNRATRFTYSSYGQVTKYEKGTTAGQSDSNWSAFSAAETIDVTYDAAGRVTQQKLSGSSGAVALTQMNYDLLGRLDCAAVRMNTSVYGSLPASACALSTQGSFGPDQISRNIYDAAGEATKLQTGVGTGQQANAQVASYSDNGKLQTLVDAEGNKTTYEYDGFDRLIKTKMPDTTKGAGTSSSTDYEQLTYDAGSNVTNRRLRDGTSIAFTYDNLNRATLKDLPGSEPDVTYAYDNLGRLTSASVSGVTASTFTYDALSRNLTQAGPQGTVASEWDVAGRRTRLTYPGSGLYVDYDYLVTGEMTKIRENGATSGIGVLATYAYDSLGRRTSLTLGNGVATTYGYDAVSRLSSLAANLSGTTNDLTIGTIGYSPAGQVTSAPRSNDGFSWTGSVALNRNYTSDGLNRYTASGTITPTYDSRGNLTSAGSTTYTYNSENRLVSASGGASATLTYDPLLRLKETSASSGTTRFAYDNTDMIAELDSSNGILRRYVHGPGSDDPLVWYEGTGTTIRKFLSADERGSIVAVSDDTGALVATNSYDEYGIPQTSVSGQEVTGRFAYTGQAFLPELGIYYYKNRMYSATLGRFMQTDPIGYGDGMNMYRYVGSDPINATDPLGLQDLNRTAQTPTIVVMATYSCSTTPSMCTAVGDAMGVYADLFYGEDRLPSFASQRLEARQWARQGQGRKDGRNNSSTCHVNPEATGQVTFTGFTVAGAFGLGGSVTTGSFRTESGVTGSFTSIEFLGGLRADIGVISGFSRNLSTFMGGNDTVSAGVALDDITASYDLNHNLVGASTTVGGGGINIGLSGGFSNTDVSIDGCPAETGNG